MATVVGARAAARVAGMLVEEAARTVAALEAAEAAEVSLVEVGEAEAAAEAAHLVGWTRGRARTVGGRRHPRASTLSRKLVRQRSWLSWDRARPRVCGRCE